MKHTNGELRNFQQTPQQPQSLRIIVSLHRNGVIACGVSTSDFVIKYDENGSMKPTEKAAVAHWDTTWRHEPKLRLPRPYGTTVRDLMLLLRREVKPGMKFLEIGCAPGKILAWTSAVLGADVSGVDYSAQGIEVSRKLFESVGVRGDLRQEDIFQNSFDFGTFDVVFSGGVIEHFDDPTEIVKIHVSLAKPGGLALIIIPNFRGVYGRILPEENLRIHNLEIMTCAALLKLCPPDLTESAEAFPYGRIAFANRLDRFAPRWLKRPAAIAGELIWLVQPFTIKALSPHLVLKIRRKRSATA